MQNLKEIRYQLLVLEREYKINQSKKRALLRELADPEKNKRLFNIAQKVYELVLESQANEELDLRKFSKNILSQLNNDDYAFFMKHKHDKFYGSQKLFSKFQQNINQITLRKLRYINIHSFKNIRISTVSQVFYYIAQAKIQLHKDILISELKSLKIKEQLRYTLFEQERFNQIVDFNERECLLMLRSNPNSTNKDLIEISRIPRSNWYRYKHKFDELGLLEVV